MMRLLLLAILLEVCWGQESFEPINFPPQDRLVAGTPFLVKYRSTSTGYCRVAAPPLIVVFVRPILYISPPIAFDRSGIVARSDMQGCQNGEYQALVTITIAANYRQEVYLYVKVPASESDQPIALDGSPFDLDIYPAPVHWPSLTIICGRVQGSPWPDRCSDGLGFDLTMAGVTIELMLQPCDRYYNPIFQCVNDFPPSQNISLSALANHSRTEVHQQPCDGLCPHQPYNETNGTLCHSCPMLTTSNISTSLSFDVLQCDPTTGAIQAFYTATLTGRYSLQLFFNGVPVPEVEYYRDEVSATLVVMPGLVNPSTYISGGQDLVSQFANWTGNAMVQLKDQYGNDRQHGLLYAFRFNKSVSFFNQDPSYIALNNNVSPDLLCRLMTSAGCNLLAVRESMQRKYLGEGVTAGIAAGTSQDLDALVTLIKSIPRQGTWISPAAIGTSVVKDMTDGRFLVAFTFRQPGIYKLALYTLGWSNVAYDTANLGSVNEKGREIVNLARFCINTSLPELTVWIKTMKLWLTRMRSSRSCIQTSADGSSDPFWLVDLQMIREVRFLRVFNRHDDDSYYSTLLDGFSVHVGDKGTALDPACATNVTVERDTAAYLVIPCHVSGRYVSVRLPGPRKVLTICEVEVMGMAGRKVSADATKGTALFAAGQRQWISLRVMWPQILMYSQKCPDEVPNAYLNPWSLPESSFPSTFLTGLQENSLCLNRTSCPPGPPLPAVSVQYSACRRGQILLNAMPTISGQYAFIVDVGGSIGTIRGSPWSMLVVGGKSVASMATITWEDLTGTGSIALLASSLTLQARDAFGNPNAECARGVEGNLTYLPLDSSQRLEYGGKSVLNMLDSSPTFWPFSQYPVPEASPWLLLEVGQCEMGRTSLSFLATISGYYRIHTSINGTQVRGSGQRIEVFPLYINLTVGVNSASNAVRAFSPHGRWSYYRLLIPPGTMGFQVKSTRLVDSRMQGGEPWLFLQQGSPPTQPRGPYTGVPSAMLSSQACFTCRVSVLLPQSPSDESRAGMRRSSTAVGSLVGDWFVGVFGAHAAVTYDLTSFIYPKVSLQHAVSHRGQLEEAGQWYLFDFDLGSGLLLEGYQSAQVVGFSCRVSRTNGRGRLDAAIQRAAEGYPNLQDQTLQSTIAQRSCVDCVMSYPLAEAMPPSDWQWKMAVMSVEEGVSFAATCTAQMLRTLQWGEQGLQRGYVGYRSLDHVAVYFDQSLFSGFRVQVIPSSGAADIRSLLMKARMAVRKEETFFPGTNCVNCRTVVQSSTNLTDLWYLTVYGGETGGYYSISALLMITCPNACSGNGVCRRKSTYYCLCQPGYEGVDCSLPSPERLSLSSLGVSPSIYLNSQDCGSSISIHCVNGQERSILLNGGFLQSLGKPRSRLNCVAGDRIEEVRLEASGQPLPPSAGVPICQSYEWGSDFAVMVWVYADRTKPGNNSGITLGSRLWTATISPENDEAAWSFMLSLQGHPSDAVDGYLVNFVVNEGDSRTNLRIASARDLDSFPSRGAPAPSWEPTLSMQTWYHLTGVYAHDRIQLFINGELIAEQRRNFTKMRHVKDSVLHIGHDSRYPIKRTSILRLVVTGNLRYAFQSIIPITSQTAISHEHHHNKGSVAAPLSASQWDDGTLLPDTINHADACSAARAPNEHWDEVSGTDADKKKFIACR
ncbi:hypothetical protein GUITHDRAFT_141946 [Guillardia theta CCMP2712]|uniref:EGF-like domain-containing protein n=1 Tax=Guillardia theta (strain CCMP2712) TaxID=905079 RepID=L1IYZ3_GUITC|nr:hypothetical protein GUITHDRAFT_141946 [Guillardia theta CCMP2712]EKX41461.1 hypothetical protein GUITHDRAFT_141946 [Guillardia theta CCMP2712]|eukprot:XP_005828441.1 hypothetical protein GUITHDRAFT_141946 [Guillardia theta CCMP2712]